MSKCKICNSNVEIKKEIHNSYKNDTSGNPILVEMNVNYCTNTQCGHSWIPYLEEKRVSAIVASRSRHRMDASLIETFRTALGLPTRSDASLFLNLNEKAFTKWENGYTEINDAYDLLLRLSVYSRENYEFIKRLHEKQFRFDPEDYELICELSGKKWNYRNPIINQSAIAASKPESKNYVDSRRLKFPLGPNCTVAINATSEDTLAA